MSVESSLLKTNFIGRDGFRWWIGQIAPAEAQEKQLNGEGWGNRYKVRIMGYHPYSTADLSDEDLPWAGALLPSTAGTGAACTGENVKLRPGDVVVGFFLDGDNGQVPMIMGAFGRTEYVGKKSYKAPFQPFTGFDSKITPPNGTHAINEINQQNSNAQRQPLSIPPGTSLKARDIKKCKEIYYAWGGIGTQIQLANSCTATGISAITGEIGNLFSRIGGLGGIGSIASAVSGLASGGSIGGVVSGLIGSVAGGSGGIGGAIGGLLGGGDIANTVGNAIGNLAGGSTVGNVITTAIGDLGGGTGIGDLLGGGNVGNAIGNAISGLAGGSSIGNIITNSVGDLVGGSSGISGAVGNLLGGSSTAQEIGGVVEQGISGAIGNLSSGILGGEVGKTIDAVTAMVNPFVGSMFNFLFSKLEPILNKGLDALYKFIFSQVQLIVHVLVY